MGYRETSKDYKIYIPRQRHIEVSHHVNFDEDIAFKRSRYSHMEIDDEEQETPRDNVTKPSDLVIHPSYYQ